jgi:hypothetical protein
MTCYWRRSTWIVQVLRLPQRCSTPTLRPQQPGHHPPRRLARPTVATAATVATGTRTTTRTATAVMAVATMAGTTMAVAAVIALLARPPPPLPLTVEPTRHDRLTTIRARAHDRLPRSGAHRTAASAGLHSHAGPLPVTWVPARLVAAAAALLACRPRSLTRLEPLGQHGLGPAIAGPLLQHHGAPPTSDFGLGLGG